MKTTRECLADISARVTVRRRCAELMRDEHERGSRFWEVFDATAAELRSVERDIANAQALLPLDT